MIYEEFNLKEWIKFYRAQGLNVAPVLADRKSPAGLFAWKKYQTEFIRDGMLTVLYYRTNKRDWHIWLHCGQTSHNIGILDIDDKDLARDRFGEFFDDTLVCETKHGFHFWFIESDQEGGTQGWADLPIDIRSQGGGVIIPPSPVRTWMGDFDLNRIKKIKSIKSMLEDMGVPDSRKTRVKIQNRTFIIPKKLKLEDDYTIFLWNCAKRGITLRYYLKKYYQGDRSKRRPTFFCTLCDEPEDVTNFALEYHKVSDEFHCYACLRQGGLLEMVMYDRGLSESEAVLWIQKLYIE